MDKALPSIEPITRASTLLSASLLICLFCRSISASPAKNSSTLNPCSLAAAQAQNLRDTICHLCNESKNDKLASTEQLQRLVKRNEEIISTQKSGSILINTNEYDNTTLMRFYHIAKMNGFELWEEGNSK